MSDPDEMKQSPVYSGASFRWRCMKWLAGSVVVMLCGGALFALYIPTTRPRDRNHCRNNLKQIGLALHNYHGKYGKFPPAYVADAQGRPMHSWRVLILPYLDQESLYSEYRFDEPWDGPNNRKLEDRVMAIYHCPSEETAPNSPESRYASYLAIIGPHTLWTGERGVCPCDIYDGDATTLHLVEVANSGIHWMEPRDLHVGQMATTINPPAGQGMSSIHENGAHALFADGSSRFLTGERLPAETIRGLLTIQGGETIPDDF